MSTNAQISMHIRTVWSVPLLLALWNVSGSFLGLIWAPSQIKNERKLPKIVYTIPNVLVPHFGEIFMKIGTKIAKLQMQENLHKNVNENNVFIHIFMQIFMSYMNGS